MLPSQTLLRGLPNIGATIAARLEGVGVRTVGDLQRIGPAEVFQRVRANNPGRTISVCYYLYSLQGALEGKHWDDLAEETKRALLKEVGEAGVARKPRVATRLSPHEHGA